MFNAAGRADVDDAIEAELLAAGIAPYRMLEMWRDSHPEMRTVIMGHLGPWSFKRAWRYWACDGPGIPLAEAEALDKTHGKVVRADGDCACRGPRFWNKGLATGLYHVDTQEGLNALADTIRDLMRRAEAPTTPRILNEKK
jgi:hypothetical protein